MILAECFDRTWIDDRRQALQVNDPGLLEKCIHAMHLLCCLSAAGFDFVFKGGTSMVLLLQSLRRLSIDIDIACTAERVTFEPFLEQIGRMPPFLRFEEDDRGEDRLPRRCHFKFFYNSIYSRREDYVLLDILEEENHFPQTTMIPIQTSFLNMDGEVSVRVPSLDCLLGDKLTAFAPNTVGVPLNERCNMQVVKQMFDVGELFNAAENLEMVKETYAAVFAAENGYRGFKCSSLAEALDDTIATCALVCQINLKGATTHESTPLIQDGISRIGNHLVGGPYNLDHAKLSAAKAACLAAILKQNTITQTPADIRFDKGCVAELRKTTIKNWPVLNRLKGVSSEAFYYWSVVDRVRAGNNRKNI